MTLCRWRQIWLCVEKFALHAPKRVTRVITLKLIVTPFCYQREPQSCCQSISGIRNNLWGVPIQMRLFHLNFSRCIALIEKIWNCIAFCQWNRKLEEPTASLTTCINSVFVVDVKANRQAHAPLPILVSSYVQGHLSHCAFGICWKLEKYWRNVPPGHQKVFRYLCIVMVANGAEVNLGCFPTDRLRGSQGDN